MCCSDGMFCLWMLIAGMVASESKDEHQHHVKHVNHALATQGYKDHRPNDVLLFVTLSILGVICTLAAVIWITASEIRSTCTFMKRVLCDCNKHTDGIETVSMVPVVDEDDEDNTFFDQTLSRRYKDHL